MKSKIWMMTVLGVLLFSLCFGCSLITKGVGPIPPMDAYNNVTGEAGADGKTDQAYTEYIHNAKITVDAATGGITAPYSGLGELAITGVTSIAVAIAYALKRDKQDKKDVMDELKVTDKNVETVAKAANVPDAHLL